MISLNSEQRKEIAKAIGANEKFTSGEIYCVVARKSSDYHFSVMFISAVLALLIPIIMISFNIDFKTLILNQFFGWGAEYSFTTEQFDLSILLCLQILILILGSIISTNDTIKNLIVPKFVKRQAVHKQGIDQFLAHGIKDTMDKTGVLIYVSLSEKIVEVFADEGIYKKVDKQVWHNAVGKILLHTKQGDLKTGLIEGINEVGGVLKEHFPPRPDDVNELSDSVVFI